MASIQASAITSKEILTIASAYALCVILLQAAKNQSNNPKIKTEMIYLYFIGLASLISFA